MTSLRILSRDHPHRTLALATDDCALIFQYTSESGAGHQRRNNNDPPRCLVEFVSHSSAELKGYRSLGLGFGTLGLVTLDEDVFLCVVTGSSRAATVRPGETVSRIDNVDFYSLNRSDYEDGLEYAWDSSFAAEDNNNGPGMEGKEMVTDHPFLALKKLLSDGSFYYSLDFNLTDRLQDRSDKSAAFDIESLKEDMLWNSYMIHPLLLFRNRLSPLEKQRLDSSQILTCVIRGFASTVTVPAIVHVIPEAPAHHPSLLTIISRQSSRRAGTRFNSRGIDDDGHVANFVETELILWVPPGTSFSYVQIRGSVPLFWEQASGFIPGQQKIEITRSSEATQYAFNKHFEHLELEYGAIHVVNLLSELKPAESELSAKFREQIRKSSLAQKAGFDMLSDHALLRVTEFDFHAEARGPQGYGASNQIKHEISHSLHGFAYFLSDEDSATTVDDSRRQPRSSSVLLQQEGVFRTNCLDCLDRTNLVQTIISLMALESFLHQKGASLSSAVQVRHSSLWADNGDALSKIYAGTGALKSSFTRHGKMSLAGALADARKTATRLYVNNFADKARQKTIDLLLGRLADQVPVYLFDPINDLVSEELSRRTAEYSFTRTIKIWTGTFNVNGRHLGADVDLSPWLWPSLDEQDDIPAIVAVGFQEIVPLSPQQIMSTDPTTRKVWEVAVKNCLNNYAAARGTAKYILLRSGQLVGTALMIFVREEALNYVKNVEGSVKKTGLSGMAGNKGGCAIRFDYSSTRLCFVTAHLAAGFGNYEERNRDYETISHGLRFQKNRSIADHDAIIWLGDFNYRIGRDNQTVRDLVARKDFQKLYDNDQLNLGMLKGWAFQFYTEGTITFPPTYKYDVGRDEYDTSEKARIPAWCDRILWRGSGLQQTNYQAANLRFSDHRPVWATFSCKITVIDETVKSKLRQQLYKQRQRDPRNVTKDLMGSETEDLIMLESIAPGLPPASSDNQKWWLDNGMPVRSTVKPPSDDYILNVFEQSNPFPSPKGSDWVNIHGHQDGDGPRDPKNDDSSHRPALPPRVRTASLKAHERPANVNSSSPKSAGTSHPNPPKDQKSAPPIPRKPVSLSIGPQPSPSTPGRMDPGAPARRAETRPGDRSGVHGLEGMANVSLTDRATPKSRWRNPAVNKHQEGSLLDSPVGMPSPPPAGSGDLLDGALDEKVNWKPLMPN
ncbi:DNase I-like protein [Aspergillus terreus]|uniref:phosphoinositide 5-phosphatase n=1 Tax=Aspergillus terreus TaxID=33178 RepID=A0A8H3MSR4_ASPTE|nr:DNase I-like protein [Aspergillus terreus]